jgi:hypothetical protein
MRWVPPAAVAWALAYGMVRIWWAMEYASSVPPASTDLVVFTGWYAVSLCAAAGGIGFALTRAPWRRALLVAAWGVTAALLVASAPLLLDVVGGLLPGLGARFHLVGLLNRAAACAGGILLGATAEAYRRRWSGACLFCGRTAYRAKPAGLPRWAVWGAYAAMAGWLLRLGAQAAVGFDFAQGGAMALLVFEIGFVLAGVALPLALVRPWGRVLPRRIPLLAGRRVPRWLLLGPAFAIAGGMVAYFGFTLLAITAETLTGTWQAGADDLPLAFFWVAVPAYILWGLGLGAAAFGYYQATRPSCSVCAS